MERALTLPRSLGLLGSGSSFPRKPRRRLRSRSELKVDGDDGEQRDAAATAKRRSMPRHTREIVQWHFDPDKALPFWLEFAEEARLRPAGGGPELRGSPEVSPCSRTTGFAAGPVRRWVPKAYQTSRSTSSRPVVRRGSPRAGWRSTISESTTSSSATRFRRSTSRRGSELAHVGSVRSASSTARGRAPGAAYRGGIAFCLDLDPRWVIKLIKKGWTEHLEAYKSHVIDQAVTHRLGAGHDIQAIFATPKLLESSRACAWKTRAARCERSASRVSSRAGRSSRRSGPASRSKSSSTASTSPRPTATR